MKLTLVSSTGGVTRVDCAGEITQSELWNNANPLEALLGESGYRDRVLVSLEKTDYIDSAGIGWFILCHKKFRECGGMLVLYSIPPLASHIFQLLQMHTVLHLAKDEAAALALAQGGQP
jgi:anti-anti-sigma factor